MYFKTPDQGPDSAHRYQHPGTYGTDFRPMLWDPTVAICLHNSGPAGPASGRGSTWEAHRGGTAAKLNRKPGPSPPRRTSKDTPRRQTVPQGRLDPQDPRQSALASAGLKTTTPCPDQRNPNHTTRCLRGKNQKSQSRTQEIQSLNV